MSMILKKTDRTELIRQLGLSAKAISHKTSKVLVAKRGESEISVIAVRERPNGIFLYTYRHGAPEIAIAPIMGSDFHDHTVEEVIEKLERCKGDTVYLQWPADDPSIVVGKVFCVGHGDELTAYLFPVPKDIEQVNEEVRRMCADYGCEKAASGMQCGDCAECGVCAILKEVDEKITRERNGR